MSNYVSIIFCRRCGSRYVEISEWSDGGKGIIRCRTCNNHEEVSNFTLGRAGVTKSELENARTTKARSGRYEK